MSGVDDKKEKEADIPWFTQKTNKALDTGLALLHVGTGHPLTRVLQARARKLAQWASAFQRISLRERQRKREKKKERHGDPSSDGTRVFFQHQFSSVDQSCPTLCDPMNRSTPGLPFHHQLPEFTQTHVHQVSDAIQSSHPLTPSSPSALNLSQNQGLFQ